MGKGRVAYEKAWAWRIVFLALGAVAASGSAASAHSYRALSARQTTQAMEDAGKKVGRQYVRNCLYRFYTRGDPSKLRDSERRSNAHASPSQRRWIKKTLRRDPSLYFDEISLRFRTKFGRTISDKMISKALKHDGGQRGDRPLSLKRLQVLARQRCEAKRLECRLGMAGLDPECLIIIDESHVADADYRRRRGWAPIGEPALIHEYFRDTNGQLRSVLAAVNQDGFVLDACKVVDGGVDDDALYDWAVAHLAPVLNPYDERSLPNSIIVLDNATIHHQPRFRQLLKDIGVLVFFLAPYSPDFSPIEPCFHQMKAWLKRHRALAAVDPQQALLGQPRWRDPQQALLGQPRWRSAQMARPWSQGQRLPGESCRPPPGGRTRTQPSW